MAVTQKLYPRGTVKRIVKAQSNRSVSKNADILVCGPDNNFPIALLILLDLLRLHAIHARVCLCLAIPISPTFPPPRFERLPASCFESWRTGLIHSFFFRLMREASIHSQRSGEKNISANTVRKVTEVCFIYLAFEHIYRNIANKWEQKTLRKFQG